MFVNETILGTKFGLQYPVHLQKTQIRNNSQCLDIGYYIPSRVLYITEGSSGGQLLNSNGDIYVNLSSKF